MHDTAKIKVQFNLEAGKRNMQDASFICYPCMLLSKRPSSAADGPFWMWLYSLTNEW